MQLFLTAVALLLVIEGLLPFAAPRKWRKFVLVISLAKDKTIRLLGLTSMIVGAVLLYILSH